LTHPNHGQFIGMAQVQGDIINGYFFIHLYSYSLRSGWWDHCMQRR
jgi:hypothetical protein